MGVVGAVWSLQVKLVDYIWLLFQQNECEGFLIAVVPCSAGQIAGAKLCWL